jgi:serine/threonine-protein kinase
VKTPDVVGQVQQAAQRNLNAAGLRPVVLYVPSDKPQSTVVSQSPNLGTTQKRGTRVQLRAAIGPDAAALETVPNVAGLDAATARSRLRDAGFKVQTLRRRVSNQSQVGRVVDEQPAGARRAPAGSMVTIYVGS